MKLAFLSILGIFAVIPLSANNTFMRIPGHNDTITKQIYPYHDAGAGGIDIFWDFRDLNEGTDYPVCNSLANANDSTEFVSDEHATRYYYKECEHELYCMGYENASSFVRYDSMELQLNTSLQYGDTISRPFYGRGEYAHRLPFKVEGFVCLKVDGKGTLLLPEETISPVIRVCTEKHHSRIMNDTVLLTTQSWKWFSPACPYPIVETMRTISDEDSTLFGATFLFTPKEQKEQELPVDEYYLNSSVYDSIFTNASFLPNPVTSSLIVTYTLEEPAYISFALHYQGGILMYRCNRLLQEAGAHNYEIPMSSMPTGAYTLYIHVNDVLISEPIIKQ